MFQKGNKLGGRKPGSKNKTTEEIRGIFSELLTNNLDTLQQDLDTLQPEDRIKALISISKFVIPTLKATEINAANDNQPPVIINLGSGVNPETEADANNR